MVERTRCLSRRKKVVSNKGSDGRLWRRLVIFLDDEEIGHYLGNVKRKERVLKRVVYKIDQRKKEGEE